MRRRLRPRSPRPRLAIDRSPGAVAVGPGPGPGPDAASAPDAPPNPDAAPPPPPSPRGARRRHGRRKRRLPLWIAVIGWIITGGLALLALLRVVAWDDLEPLAVLNAGTVALYLPTWVVAVVALVGRRFVLAGAALLVVLAQILFLLPELTATEPLPSWAATAPSIRLFDANVYYENPSMAGYAAQIKAFKPQLLTMEEAVPPFATQLRDDGALAGLPYQLEVKRYDPRAFFIASKYPLSGQNVVYYDYLPLIVQTTVHLPFGNVLAVGRPHRCAGPRIFRGVEERVGVHRQAGGGPGTVPASSGGRLQRHVEQQRLSFNSRYGPDRRCGGSRACVLHDVVTETRADPTIGPDRSRAHRDGRGGHEDRHRTWARQ